MSLSQGERFDRYVIEDVLGEGGMARVYRAHDPRLHRRVALKVLRLDSSTDPDTSVDATARVMREARAAAALDHPNAVSVFDVGEADGQLFIAMELVVGKSLRAYVGDASVSWETKLRWMLDAARALGAAHERGLVHRDVKPENVMVRADGVVKVLDFGIAKRMRVDVGSSVTLDGTKSQSFAGGIVGTPWYLSPEQLRGDAVDGRADQFAWGVMTYEVLTGALPWPKGVDGFQLVLAILNRMPEPPSKLLKALPSIVDATILKTLAKGRAQRFDDMDAVVAALEGIVATSRRSWAHVPTAMTKTDPAPPMDGLPAAVTPATSEALAPAQPTNEPTTLPTRAPPELRLRRPRLVVAGLVAVAAAVAFASVRWWTPRPGATTAAPSQGSSARADSTPTAITDAPMPASGATEALAAYRSFRVSFRSADWSAAMRSLETAVARDPSMAAAQMRLAFMRSLETVDEGLVRSTFMKAVRGREALDERDAALLDALAPYLQNDPSDPLESARRLEELRARRPLDAEIAYVLGSVRFDRGDLRECVDALDAAIAVDPDFALAWSSKGGCLAYMGRFDQARAALDEALKRSRTATEPLWYLAEIDEQGGRCEAEETRIRAWLSRDPDDWYGYHYLSRVLAAEGKPWEAVLTALEQKWVRLEPGRRAAIEPTDRSLVAVAQGDFAEAERLLGDMAKVLASDPGAQAHALSHSVLARIAEEEGHPERARAVAEAYLSRKDAWAPTHRVDNVAIYLDPVPELLGVLVRSGAITPAEHDRRRAAWLDAWRAKTSAAYVGDLWLAAWARPADTKDEAQAALDALPSFGAAPPFSPNLPSASLLGHAYLVAGRTADALPALRAGAATCTRLDDPFASTRGWLDLGTALEAQGDAAGACAAYRVVLDRWGKARPRSVTADRARARLAALACR